MPNLGKALGSIPRGIKEENSSQVVLEVLEREREKGGKMKEIEEDEEVEVEGG